MKDKPLHGTASHEQGKRLFFDFDEQWSAFFRWSEMNWIDFTLIQIEGEVERATGRIEAIFGLLGFLARVTYVYDDSFNNDLLSTKEQFTRDLKMFTGAKEVRDPFGVLDKLDQDTRQ